MAFQSPWSSAKPHGVGASTKLIGGLKLATRFPALSVTDSMYHCRPTSRLPYAGVPSAPSAEAAIVNRYVSRCPAGSSTVRLPSAELTDPPTEASTTACV